MGKQVDLAELASLRWIEGKGVTELARIFNYSPITIGQYLRKLRRGSVHLLSLDPATKNQIIYKAQQEQKALERSDGI